MDVFAFEPFPKIEPVVAGHLLGKMSSAVENRHLPALFRQKIGRHQPGLTATKDDHPVAGDLARQHFGHRAQIHPGGKQAFDDGHIRQAARSQDRCIRIQLVQ